MSKGSDVGRQIFESLTEWTATRKVPVVAGELVGDAAFVRISPESDGEPAKQLTAILDRMSVDFLAIDSDTFEAEDLKDAVDDLTSQHATAEELAAVKACRRFLGQVAVIRLRVFLKSGVILGYDYRTPWFDIAYGEAVDPDEAAYREKEEEQRKWTYPRRGEVARKIASDPRFPKAKSEYDRVLLTRHILADECPRNDHLVKEISREAKAVYEMEIKPERS